MIRAVVNDIKRRHEISVWDPIIGSIYLVMCSLLQFHQYHDTMEGKKCEGEENTDDTFRKMIGRGEIGEFIAWVREKANALHLRSKATSTKPKSSELEHKNAVKQAVPLLAGGWKRESKVMLSCWSVLIMIILETWGSCIQDLLIKGVQSSFRGMKKMW